jgi:hypothetical protein
MPASRPLSARQYGQIRQSIKVTDGPQKPQEHVTRSLRRKQCQEDVTRDRASADVEPIFPTEATRSVNEVVELRVQGSHLRCRERVCAPCVLSQGLESCYNLFLLVRGEPRILGNVIGIRAEQPGLSPKLSPKIRRFEIAFNLCKPGADARSTVLTCTRGVARR